MLTNEISEQKIRDIVDQILKRREFYADREQNPVVKLIGDIWEAIQDWVREILQYRQPNREIRINPNLFNSELQTVLRILLILITAVLLFLLVRLIIRRVYLPNRIKKIQVPKAYDYLDKPDEAMEKFKTYMDAKEYSKAFRFLFISVLLELDRRKIIKIEKWKTNRIYIREISLKNKDLITPMQELSNLFNACCYGNKAIDKISVETWLNFYLNQKEKPV